MTSARPPLLTARIVLWRARHALVGVVCVAAAVVVGRAVAPPPAPTTAVVVTARAVTAGDVLAEGDLRTVDWPEQLVPHDVVDDPAGRASLVDLPAGIPVVKSLLAGDRYDVAVPRGAVVVPVRLADPAVAALLRAGDRIDLVRPDDAGPAEVVARGALVVRLQEPAEQGGGPLGLGGSGSGAAHVVVAVGPAEGRALAAAGAWGDLGAVLVGG